MLKAVENLGIKSKGLKFKKNLSLRGQNKVFSNLKHHVGRCGDQRSTR